VIFRGHAGRQELEPHIEPMQAVRKALDCGQGRGARRPIGQSRKRRGLAPQAPEIILLPLHLVGRRLNGMAHPGGNDEQPHLVAILPGEVDRQPGVDSDEGNVVADAVDDFA